MHPLGEPVPEKQEISQCYSHRFCLVCVFVAGIAGGDDIAKTGHCGFASKNTARDVKSVVTKEVQAPQPYIVTIPITNNKTGLMKYEDHPVLLPHELIYYLVFLFGGPWYLTWQI